MPDRRPPTSDLAVLMSGGLDSAILLGDQLGRGERVQPIYIRSQLVWQREELAAAKRFLRAMRRPGLRKLVVLNLPLTDLYGSHWSVSGRQAPDATTPDEAVYLPGRNPLLLVKAAIWCHLHDIQRLALATLASNPFADATDEFFVEFESVLNRALSAGLSILRPFAQLDKRQVMELGRQFPLGETFSCIAPVDARHCGRCNKCAERQQAFRLIGLPDPTEYDNETGHDADVATPGATLL